MSLRKILTVFISVVLVLGFVFAGIKLFQRLRSSEDDSSAGIPVSFEQTDSGNVSDPAETGSMTNFSTSDESYDSSESFTEDTISNVGLSDTAQDDQETDEEASSEIPASDMPDEPLSPSADVSVSDNETSLSGSDTTGGSETSYTEEIGPTDVPVEIPVETEPAEISPQVQEIPEVGNDPDSSEESESAGSHPVAEDDPVSSETHTSTPFESVDPEPQNGYLAEDEGQFEVDLPILPIDDIP